MPTGTPRLNRQGWGPLAQQYLERLVGMGAEDRDARLETELRGTTLRVYYYMIEQSVAVGVREVQRALSMSSPSVASHHLNKLVDLELVERRDDNTYQLRRLVKVGVLRNFVEYRGMLLPRYVFVAMFFTAYVIVFTIISCFFPAGLFDRLAAIAVGVCGTLFAWYETLRLWKLKLT